MSEPVVSDPGDAASAHLVVAEDDEDVQRILEFNLRNEGYDLTVFDNGRDCWDFLWREGAPDVVVLDVKMPGLSGFEVLRKIRDGSRLGDVPVIMLTSRDREEDVVTGFESGADHYVSKPFSPRELVSRIERVL